MLQAAALVAASMENAGLLTSVESGLREEQLLTRRMAALVELTRLPDGPCRGIWIEGLVLDVSDELGADGARLRAGRGDRLVPDAVEGLDCRRGCASSSGRLRACRSVPG